jgi:cephalosporin-C deacetylase
MMKKINCLLFFSVMICLVPMLKASAAIQQEKPATEETGDIILTATPQHKDAIFKNNETVSYKLEVRNNTKEHQTGRISYLVTTDFGDKVAQDTVHMSLHGKASKEIDIKVPSTPTGFYRINFMVNTSEYDDTVRRVFGVAPDKINSTLHRPADFDAFWRQSKTDLEKVNPQYKVLERPDLSTKEKKVYSVEMRSYGNILIRGWLVIPTDGKKFPVHYRVPGYVVSLKPNMASDDFISFDLNVRGNGNSKDVIDIGTDTYCLVNIEDKNKYIYRGVFMDCIRGMDFLYSHSNLGIDTSKIIAEGGSQGGALALITTALDSRVKILTLQVPLYADIHDDMRVSASYEKQVFPFNIFRLYNDRHPDFTWDKFFQTFDYYDPQNFAQLIKCPVLMGIGLLDRYCPPRCSMALFNHIASTDKEFVCVANTAHEVNFNYFMFQNMWLREKFRMP